MNQFVDITGGALINSFSNIDTSNFLTVARANSLYVNESGDDVKNGILDMKNNKIINVPIPSRSSDVTNKEYVDDIHEKLRKNVITLVGEIEKYDAKMKSREISSKAYVDAQNAETKSLLVNDFVSRGNNFKELQSFWKGIDLRNTKISNLSEPTLPSDGVNLSYLTKVMERVTALETIASKSQSGASEFRVFVDNHKWSGESITSGTINMNRLPHKQYGFILNIGSSSASQKTSIFKFKFPSALNITYKNLNLQVPLILETVRHNDDIFINIRHYEVIDTNTNTIVFVTVNTHRSSKDLHWGLHLKAHLSMTILNTEMMEINPE